MLRSTAHDMLTFLDANLGEPETDLERSIGRSHRLPEGARGGVGLCWHLQPVGGSTLVWHNGGTGGFRSLVGFDPALEVGVVALSNSAHGVDDIGMHPLDDAIPLSPTPTMRTEVEIARSVLERYVGVYELVPQFQLTVTLDADGLGVQAIAVDGEGARGPRVHRDRPGPGPTRLACRRFGGG